MTAPSTNKIKYGLRNVHYAVITEDPVTGAITYGTPKRIPGAVSLTLEPAGETFDFYADDSAYYSEATNNGYDGELEVANLTDEFRIDVLGDTYENGVMYENADQVTKPFALLFEFQGDKKAKRHVLYYCKASRPTVAGQTKAENTEPQTSTLNFTARPRPDTKEVKADTTPEIDQALYDSWYTQVHVKGATTGV
jgi:phi13 family phage major tail protein